MTTDKAPALTARQMRAIEALMIEPTITAAAEAADVSRNTLTKWLQDAQFCAVLTTATTERITTSSRLLAGGAVDAIETLRALMGEGQPANIRLQAAREWLSQMQSLRGLAAIEERIERLERAHDEATAKT